MTRRLVIVVLRWVSYSSRRMQQCWAGTGRLFPLTSGVASLYGVLLRHRPATAAWGTGGLVWLLVTSAAYLAAGGSR